MDMDDDGMTDPAAEFGELFEGQVFESELGDHDADEMLVSIGNDLGIGTSPNINRSTGHDDILDGNLQFVPDDYLNPQNIVMDNESSGYLGSMPDVSALDDSQDPLQHLENVGVPEMSQGYGQPTSSDLVNVLGDQFGGVGGGASSSAMNTGHIPGYSQGPAESIQPSPAVTPVVDQKPAVKKRRKVKIVKDVVHFTNENMTKLLKRRGFITNHGEDFSPKSVSKAVFALSNQTNNFQHHNKLISFGAQYDIKDTSQEIERFWKFYCWSKRSCVEASKDLLPMLVPLLLHFSFEATLNNRVTDARHLSYEFGRKFLGEDRSRAQENYTVLLAVTKITSVDMLRCDSILSPLLNRRCTFSVSETTLTHLRKFLALSKNPILPNLFITRFKIRSKEVQQLMAKFDWEKMLDSEEESDSDFKMSQNLDEGNEMADDEYITSDKDYVLDVINEVRNSTEANLPAVSVYTASDKPICGAFSKQGSMMAFGLTEAGIRLYSTDEARELKADNQSQDCTETGASFGRYINGHAGTVYGVHFHPRTKALFSVGQDSLMRVWDLNTENQSRCRAIYRGHSGPIWKLDMPSSGCMIATAGMDTTARIFLPERTEFVRIMAGHYFSVNTVKFHPNEAYIATGSADKSARLWSVNDGNLVRMFTGVLGTVNCVAFHGSGKYLAGAGEGKKIVIWDIAEGEVLLTLNCLNDCKDLIFCGSMLTACYRNGMLQFFNLRPILGGPESEYEFDCTNPSLYSPFTTRTSAKTVFKLYYKNHGTLYCLGSQDYQRDESTTKATKAPTPTPTARTTSTASSSKKTSVSKKRKPSNKSNPESKVNTHTLLQQVLQTNVPPPPVPVSVGEILPSGSSASSSTNMASSSKILAARLSQPPPSTPSSIGSGTDEGDVASTILSDNSEMPPSVPPTPTKSTISSSDLDAAIARVIDQSGGDQSGSGGTITMYASS